MIIRSNGYIKINLSFFEGEKTEQPTDRRKEKAREEGQVALSREVCTALMFIVCFYTLKFSGNFMYEKGLEIYNYSFSLIADIDDIFQVKYMTNLITFLYLRVMFICLPMFAVALLVGVISNVIQVGWHPTIKPLMPKLSNISPINGFKRVFSLKSLMEFVKSLIKLVILSYAIYSSLKNEVNQIQNLLLMEIMPAVIYVSKLCVNLGIKIGYWFIAIAILDFAFERYNHNKKLKMTKQEVKDEYKQSEGDPYIKSKIRQKMREASMRRMMQEVPEADVIITNPTHFAVAIKYDKDKSPAPVVTAKGADHLARRIKEIAKENEVEIVENKPLARALYAKVDIGNQIPEEMYQAVAEVLAFVYNLKNKQ